MPADLAGWLHRLEAAHPQAIELGLERVGAVALRLGVLNPSARVVTVGGTNGKGSVTAVVAALAGQAGYRVGAYTSPHFIRFNERIQINGGQVGDDELVGALERVELARQEASVSLTYFEHTTLAAFILFDQAGCDLWVLEVGLGGRLDAVNLLDADVAVVTRIAQDHAEWLGSDLESIAREKAGIFRAHKAAVIGQADAPPALAEVARQVGAQPLLQAGDDFEWQLSEDSWDWQCGSVGFAGLPLPAIAGAAALVNVATALAAFIQLAGAEQAGLDKIAAAVGGVKITGRLQLVEHNGLEWLFDVAHNADGAAELSRVLGELPAVSRCHAIFALARRKHAGQVVAELAGGVDSWYLPALDDPQMYRAGELIPHIDVSGGRIVSSGGDISSTLEVLEQRAESGDRVVVFGSFLTVAAVQQQKGWG